MPVLLFGSISTLVDTAELQRDAFNKAFAEHGLAWNWSQEEYRSLLQDNGGTARIEAYARTRGEDVDAAAVHATKSRIFRDNLAASPVAPRPGGQARSSSGATIAAYRSVPAGRRQVRGETGAERRAEARSGGLTARDRDRVRDPFRSDHRGPTMRLSSACAATGGIAMAVYHPTKVTCSCGHTFSADLAESINAGRAPEVRRKILDGEFHRVLCPACGRSFTAEKRFYYTDLTRKAVFQVRERSQRYRYRDDSRELARAVEAIPDELSSPEGRQLRVVYGMDELREKLVAQDAGYDDRMVELFKVLLLNEHPFLLQTPRLQLFLGGATPTRLSFVAYHHNRPDGYRVTMARGVADDLIRRRSVVDGWVRSSLPNEPLFDLTDSWVNFRRWTTRYAPLDWLHRTALAVQAGRTVDLTTDGAGQMFDRMPRGNQLPGRAKAELRALFTYAKTHDLGMVEDRLFEIRFGIALDDEWATNSDPDDIDTIWKLLRDLPDSNVEGNTELVGIDLFSGGGGFYQWSGVIEIGDAELSDQERFEDVLRHEVGHAVHNDRMPIVNQWLEESFGWRFFSGDLDGAEEWVQLLGGWGSVRQSDRAQIRQFLVTALGGGASWQPGPTPAPAPSHPWWTANFGPRLAFEQTGADWYLNYPTWHRSGGKAFFLNYWYAEFMVVDSAALDLVDRMPDSYASMSYLEFFAELYSLYYDLDDPQRPVVPAPVAQWLDANIGIYDPKRPRTPGPSRYRISPSPAD